MVKSVIGDIASLAPPSRLSFITHSRLEPILQIGLVIGKLNSKLDSGFVYGLVPTPRNDAGEQPCSVVDGAGDVSKSKKKVSSKAKSQSESSSLFIDHDWVFEHARQVSRMLLGGMKVVGIHIWVSESLFKNSTITLCQFSASLPYNMFSERLKLPIPRDDGSDIKIFSDALRNEIIVCAKELKGVKTLIDGKLEDIIRSLLSRLDIMCDEAERDVESVTGGDQGTNSLSSEEYIANFDLQAQRKQCNLSFPRRVFVPWLDGAYICDYIQSKETLEILKDQSVELMSVECTTDSSEILEPESEAPAVTASTGKTFWNVTTDHSSPVGPHTSVSKTRKTGNGRPAKTADFVVLFAIFFLLVAIVVFSITGKM
ncbi:hypothetical protein SASPL_134827 [Salvia splendens]|uniref:Protein odr-4 n=1 Tax=Salvia splendens TaxID=180675 RepID=A0A8X8WX19_SALSN|nr:hypothetical protein SASPL_134827 [Salvia splendens]